MNENNTPRLGWYVIGYFVLSASIVGYFVGMQSPMRMAKAEPQSIPTISVTTEEDGVLLATSYADIGDVLRSHRVETTPILFPAATYEPQAVEQPISQSEKLRVLTLRAENRAFNGAPPTIPHSIEQMSAVACLACHGEGTQSKTLRISKMSHAYYTNCTQCHVEQGSALPESMVFGASEFQGLPAPKQGSRAFAGAPPQVPHSSWMRENCLSCHGFTSKRGLQTTHPWRQNCSQCHATSAELEQLPLASKPAFLNPPSVSE